MCIAVPLNEIVVSAVAEGISVVGQQYRVLCNVLFPEGIVNPITVEWYDSEGLISNGSGITIGPILTSQSNLTSVLEFNPFRTAHGGRFSCRATVTTQTPPFNVSKSSEVDVIVGGE